MAPRVFSQGDLGKFSLANSGGPKEIPVKASANQER